MKRTNYAREISEQDMGIKRQKDTSGEENLKMGKSIVRVARIITSEFIDDCFDNVSSLFE